MVAALVAGACTVLPAGVSPPSAVAVPDPPAKVTTHTITTDEGRTLTLRLGRVDVRGPHFEVLVQDATGALVKRRVKGAKTYLGTVDGDPAAVAVAVRRRGGVLAGQVTLDRGGTLRFEGGEVVDERGLQPPSAFAWPSATDPARNRTVRKGEAGRATYRFDIGFDLDSSYFVGDLGGSVRRAVEEVQLTTVELLALYEVNARLRPAIGRVVLRGSAATSPYGGGNAALGDIRTEWRTIQASTPWDDVAYLHSSAGGGVAYVATAGTDYGVSRNGGGNDIDIIRHELGHNWGPSDNHTNGPEGPTVESGNQYARFDGTELAAIFGYRDRRQAETSPFATVPTAAVSLPPYAALDLVDRAVPGAARRIRPVRNDHDANGDRLFLVKVARRSHLGGSVARRGRTKDVVYTAPTGASGGQVDWFRYVVRDATGRRATGYVVVRFS